MSLLFSENKRLSTIIFFCTGFQEGVVNNKGADTPEHPRSLINAFVVRFVESIISKLATGEILIFYLVFVAEETG